MTVLPFQSLFSHRCSFSGLRHVTKLEHSNLKWTKCFGFVRDNFTTRKVDRNAKFSLTIWLTMQLIIIIITPRELWPWCGCGLVGFEEDSSHSRGSTIMNRSHQRSQSKNASSVYNMMRHNWEKPMLNPLLSGSVRTAGVPGHLGTILKY